MSIKTSVRNIRTSDVTEEFMVSKPVDGDFNQVAGAIINGAAAQTLVNVFVVSIASIAHFDGVPEERILERE